MCIEYCKLPYCTEGKQGTFSSIPHAATADTIILHTRNTYKYNWHALVSLPRNCAFLQLFRGVRTEDASYYPFLQTVDIWCVGISACCWSALNDNKMENTDILFLSTIYYKV